MASAIYINRYFSLPSFFGLIFITLALACPPATFGAESNFFEVFKTKEQKPTPQIRTFGDEKLRREELRSAIMNFADRFAGIFAQSMDDLEQHLSTPEMRRSFTQQQYLTLAANFELAAQAHPGAALLDQMVFVTLNRMAWQDYYYPVAYKKLSRAPLDALIGLEAEIWKIADEALTADQLVAVRQLIDEWRAANPNQWRVNWIRFSNFGEVGRKPALRKIEQKGGLLAPVSQAGETAEELRFTVERAIYLLTRTQVLLNFQLEAAYTTVASQPEMVAMMDNIEGYRRIADRIAKAVEKVPDETIQKVGSQLEQTLVRISAEREAAITQALDGVSQERIDTINQLVQVMSAQRNEIIVRLDELLENVEDHSEEVLNHAFIRLNELLANVEDHSEEVLNHTFILLAALIAVFFVSLGTYRFVATHTITTSAGWIWPLLFIAVVAAIAYWHFWLITTQNG